MKLPKIKLPTLSNKQNAMLITLAVIVAIILFLSVLFSYPVETLAYLIFTTFIAFAVFCVYATYKEILKSLNKRK